MALQRDLAEQALRRLAEELGLDPLEAALGVVRVADAEMVRALRVISVERGSTRASSCSSPSAGAGSMHACALAEELGMGTVLVPRVGGVLSALGLAISDLRRDYVTPFLVPLDQTDAGGARGAWAGMEERARGDLADGPECEREADLRYRGQSFELSVVGDEPEALASASAAHEERYGYRLDEAPLEVVNLRLTATVRRPRPSLEEGEPDGPAETGRRRANFDREWTEAPVLDRGRMGRGSRVEGPAIVELAEATCVVHLGGRGRRGGDARARIRMRRSGSSSRVRRQAGQRAAGVSLFSGTPAEPA